MDKFYKNSHATATLTAEASKTDEVADVWGEFHNDPNNVDLRNRLVERYLPVVRHHANRLWAKLPDGIELDDIVSVGTFGLMDAIGAFDPNRGVKFETFCMPRVQGAMLDELRAMDWLPRKVRSRATKLNEAYKVLEGEFGRKPSEEELAKFLELPVDEVHRTITETQSTNLTSLDKKWSDPNGDNELTEMDIFADRRSEDPTERLAKKELVRVCTKGLTKNERLIIMLYYFEELTMKEIGATLDLSESRVSQMHSAIVERIKKLHYHHRHEI